MRRSLLALALAALLPLPAAAQVPYPVGPTGQSSLALIAPTVTSPTDSSNRIATTAWVNSLVNAGLPLASGKIWIGSVGNIATAQTPSGDLTVSNGGVFTFGTVNANVGSFGSATLCPTVTVNAKGLITAASATTCTPAVGSITGVAANMATWLGTPSSANLRATVTDETGTGLLYFQGGDIGTPSAGVATNLTGTAAGLTAGAFSAGNAGNLNAGTLLAARMPALTGDCTSTVGTVALTCTSINGVNLNTAWTTYTPTVTCQTGTITTLGTVSGRSKTIGKTVIAEMDVTITTVGSCVGYLSFTLPVAAASNKYAGSSYDGNTGFSGAAVILPAISTGAALSRRADSTTFAASGANIVTTITYEIP